MALSFAMSSSDPHKKQEWGLLKKKNPEPYRLPFKVISQVPKTQSF